MKAELDILVKRGVLVHVEEPTKWVSQMAVVREQNGKLRLCIDPQSLNHERTHKRALQVGNT